MTAFAILAMFWMLEGGGAEGGNGMMKRLMMSVVSYPAAHSRHHVPHVSNEDLKRRRSQNK